MQKINVTFRAVKSGMFRDTIDCVFLDDFEFGYKLTCYTKICQHSSGCLDYFFNSTRPAKNDEYQELLNELKGIYSDYELVVKNKMPSRISIIEKYHNWRNNA